MAKLVYASIVSLDGFTADAEGNFGWGEPDAEVFRFINDLERRSGTYLYGRRMYETMVSWETFDATDEPPYIKEFTILWQAAEKVVYSRTLSEVSSARTRIERNFDPQALQRLKESAGHDLSIGGPELAGQAMAAGLVDEVHLFISPITVGGGAPALPVHVRACFQLMGVDRFAGGVVHLHYGISS